MPGRITIKLNQLRFFAYHGLFAEEQKTGNEFEVNITVDYNTEALLIKQINETVNYSSVYELVKTRMKLPTPLLETLATEITDSIHTSFPQVKKIEVAIKKLNPPMVQFTGNVEVVFCQEF